MEDTRIVKIFEEIFDGIKCTDEKQYLPPAAKKIKTEDGSRPCSLESRTHYIKDLNPKLLDWRIIARVMSKSRIILPNEGREKTFFNVDLTDGTGEIRATAFKENLGKGAFERLYDMFQLDGLYGFSNLDVKEVSICTGQTSPIKNEYELMFNDVANVYTHNEIPMIKFKFMPICDIECRKKGDFVDIIGICVKEEEVKETMEKGVVEITKNFDLQDQTDAVVTVHLRGSEALKFDGSGYPIVAIKDGFVTPFVDFSSGGTGYSENRILVDSYRVNPNVRETLNLREWWAYVETGLA